MKQLNEYLSTKVDKPISFPETPEFEDIEKWLVSKNFKYVNTMDIVLWADTCKKINAHKERVFTRGEYSSNNPYTHWIAFKGNGKISENNPLFYCRTKPVGRQYITIKNCSQDIDKSTLKKFDNYKEFMNEINDFFLF